MMRLSTGRAGPPRPGGPTAWCGLTGGLGTRRASATVAGAAVRRRRAPGGGSGDEPDAAAAASGGDVAAGHGSLEAVPTGKPPPRPRRRKAAQSPDAGDGTLAPSGGRGGAAAADGAAEGGSITFLKSLFAEALSPGAAAAVPQQPKPRVKRARKPAADGVAAGPAAGPPRPDPWASYSGLFQIVAVQQARKQEQQQQQKLQRQQKAQVHQQQAQGQQQVQQQEQEQQGEEAAAAAAAPPPQPPSPSQQKRPRPAPRARVGGLFVQRLPTGALLEPVAAKPAQVLHPSARAAAQALASGLLGGRSQQGAAAFASAEQRVYVPQPPAPPTAVFGDDPAASRRDARSEALQRMRARAIRDYADTVSGALAWPVDGRQLLFSAPSNLPVAVQRTWASTGSEGGAGVDPDAAALLLPALSSEVQRALGVALPERALRGERGAVISRVPPRGVAAVLGEWASVCGADYARQLLEVEPCILAVAPGALLETLDALNRHAGLEPSDAVAYVLRHPALMGLRPDELKQQLDALGGAVGLLPGEARQLALERPELLMYTEVELNLRMKALQRLLPGAGSKLPAMVARRPGLLLRSPRALARDVRQLAATLGLTDWAAARLVAGGPAILELSVATLARRLERLKALCGAHPKWKQQLTAMSPAGLGRCLRCGDAAFDRMALLLDAGLAGSPRLPKVKRILTLPAGWFDQTFDALRAGQAAARAAASGGDTSGGAAPEEDSDDSSGSDGDDAGLLWAPESLAGGGGGGGGGAAVDANGPAPAIC